MAGLLELTSWAAEPPFSMEQLLKVQPTLSSKAEISLFVFIGLKAKLRVIFRSHTLRDSLRLLAQSFANRPAIYKLGHVRHVFFRRIHLYLALAAGLVFFVQCLTGTVLVFEEEITHALHPERYTTASSQRSAATRSAVDAAAAVKAPTTAAPSEAAPLSSTPNTGQATGRLNPQEPTISKTAEDLHRRLLAGEVGKALTGLSALFILFITTTGIVLWWPKTRAMRTGRLRIKWEASGKRLTHDLHVVRGFYCSLFLFGLALTGVSMSYRWAANGLFWPTSSQPTMALPTPRSAHRPGAAGGLRCGPAHRAGCLPPGPVLAGERAQRFAGGDYGECPKSAATAPQWPRYLVCSPAHGRGTGPAPPQPADGRYAAAAAG